MGISGLLPVLKPSQKQVHLKEYKGMSIAVDGYSWLHKAAFGCAFDLLTGKPTTKYVDFCMRKTKDLTDNGIWPIIVFDGGHLPSKKETEAKRRERKAKLREQGFDHTDIGMEYLAMGNTTKATECFQQCVDVTPDMAKEWIEVLKLKNIEFVVAPYEADAQLAYLCKSNSAYAVISEDSDLLAFGCKRVIFKLQSNMTGIEVCIENFGMIKEFRYWDHTRFRQMCILSGCDYLDSPPGIGVKTAIKLLQKTDAYTVPIFNQLIKSWKVWGISAKAPKLPVNYEKSFKMADLTFLHHWVYDAATAKCIHLNPLPNDMEISEELKSYIGEHLEPEIIRGIAQGNINPITLQKFPINENKSTLFNAKESSIHKVGDCRSNIAPGRTSMLPTMPKLLQSSNFVKVTKNNLEPGTRLNSFDVHNTGIAQSKQTVCKSNPKLDYETMISKLLNKKPAARPDSALVNNKRKKPEEDNFGKQTRVKFKATRLTDFWKVIPKRDTVSPYFKAKEDNQTS